MELVRLTTRGDGITVVTMDDQPRYNALSSQMVSELREAMASIASDRSTRAVVLTGAGRGFCAGANLAGDEELPDDARDRGPVGLVHAIQEHIAAVVLAVHELPQPVVAAVHGAAVGGGLALALASDLRVASEDAFFASQFIKVGLSSCDVGTSYFLPRLVGPTHAAELMLTGRRFDAAEADRLGLLNRLVSREELLDAACDLASEVIANSEYGVLMTKLGFWANLDAPSLRHAMELENRTQVLGTFTGNLAEASEAFREKREPRWKPM